MLVYINSFTTTCSPKSKFHAVMLARKKVREEQFCCSTQHMVRMISAPCAWSGRVLRTAVSRVRPIEDVAKIIIRADTRVQWEANKN